MNICGCLPTYVRLPQRGNISKVKVEETYWSKVNYTECVWIIGGFCKPIFSQILNTNTWCYCHLKEKCLQFHSDHKCIRCASHVWHGRYPDDTPIPAKHSQTCLVWLSRLRCWCALAILIVSFEVVGRKHCHWRNPTGRKHKQSGLKLRRNEIFR